MIGTDVDRLQVLEAVVEAVSADAPEERRAVDRAVDPVVD
jgi:hypothetical protein